jgi:hypothetical protein
VVDFLCEGEKILNMDPDSKNKSEKFEQDSNNLFNAGYVFPTSGLRCFVLANNEIDRFLLDYGFNFLPFVSLFSWILFLFV